MGKRASILLVGKSGHVRNALAALIDSLPIVDTEHTLDLTNTVNDEAEAAINTPYLTCVCDSRQAIELARENPPTVILFAGAPFDIETAEALEEIRRTVPQARCLVLTDTPNTQSETCFSADAILPTGASFNLLKATIEGLINRR